MVLKTLILVALNLTLGLGVCIFSWYETGTIVRPITAGIWTIGVSVATLLRLSNMMTLRDKDAAIQLAFETTMVLPIVGIFPIILVLLP